MQLQTNVNIPPANKELSYRDTITLIGSCFIENIGSKLERLHFNTKINPNGIAYNPFSIATTLEGIINNKVYTDDDLIQHNNLWLSLDHHGSFSNSNKNACLSYINSQMEDARNHFNSNTTLILTFGTSWVYHHKSSNKIVSNCHKIPSTEFTRYRLSIEDIVTKYIYLLNRIFTIYPDLNIIFTVSPIRHWKDGAHGNQLSKAILLLAIEQLVEKFPQASYFPSYEIVMDELRDYRYYNADMLHISQQGIDYIWEKFQDTYFSASTKTTIAKVEKLVSLTEHRSLSEDNKELLTKQLDAQKQILELTTSYVRYTSKP